MKLLRRTPFQLPCEASHTQRASSSAFAREPEEVTQTSCSQPDAAGHGHSWKPAGKQILLQVSRHQPEHQSLKQCPKFPKNPPMEARGQAECWAQLICAIFLQLIAKPIRYLFISSVFQHKDLSGCAVPKHTLTIYLLLIRNLLS